MGSPFEIIQRILELTIPKSNMIATTGENPTRKLLHLHLDISYRSLGRLRLAQGDLDAASTLLDRAVELYGRPQGPMPT